MNRRPGRFSPLSCTELTMEKWSQFHISLEAEAQPKQMSCSRNQVTFKHMAIYGYLQRYRSLTVPALRPTCNTPILYCHTVLPCLVYLLVATISYNVSKLANSVTLVCYQLMIIILFCFVCIGDPINKFVWAIAIKYVKCCCYPKFLALP